MLSFGRVERALTDGKGSFEAGSAPIRLSDYDRLLHEAALVITGFNEQLAVVNRTLAAALDLLDRKGSA